MTGNANTNTNPNPIRHEFDTAVQWRQGKEGTLTAGTLPAIEVGSPPVFGGPPGKWTPEHLFVASAEVCVMMTFLAMAGFSKLAVRSYRSKATGTLEKLPGEGFRFTSIELSLDIGLESESDAARAERILEKAEASCLVSKSMRTPVRIRARFDVPA